MAAVQTQAEMCKWENNTTAPGCCRSGLLPVSEFIHHKITVTVTGVWQSYCGRAQRQFTETTSWWGWFCCRSLREALFENKWLLHTPRFSWISRLFALSPPFSPCVNYSVFFMHVTCRVYAPAEFCSELFFRRSCHLLALSCWPVNLSKTFDLHAAAGTFVVSEFCNSQIRTKSLSSAPSQHGS